MADYNEKILQHFADRLYRRATWIIVKYVIVGVALGALLGYVPVILWFFNKGRGVPPDVGTQQAFCAVVLGVVFGVIGENKAFEYKLRAQTTLCLMQIQRNTRKVSEEAWAQGAS